MLVEGLKEVALPFPDDTTSFCAFALCAIDGSESEYATVSLASTLVTQRLTKVDSRSQHRLSHRFLLLFTTAPIFFRSITFLLKRYLFIYQKLNNQMQRNHASALALELRRRSHASLGSCPALSWSHEAWKRKAKSKRDSTQCPSSTNSASRRPHTNGLIKVNTARRNKSQLRRHTHTCKALNYFQFMRALLKGPGDQNT